MTKTLIRMLVVVPATLMAMGGNLAMAGSTIDEKGVIVCVNEKWDEKEVAKGHKLVDYAGRCVKVPDDASAAKTSEACSGKYEYLPDGTWKAKGICAATQKAGDVIEVTWEEGSALNENPYRATGGSGKFKGVTGGGTYQYAPVTETLYAGRYHSQWQLP